MRVLIVGAGLGGLNLAHGLRKAGIDVQVFEKQGHVSDNLAGYGIHIDANGRRPLQSCLPASNWSRFKDVSISAGTQMFFRDTDLRLLAERDDAKITGVLPEEIERRGIGRVELREILLDGLDGEDGESCVHWGKALKSFVHPPNGRIQVCFVDGAVEEGDVLVGADGPHSVVRQQYLPHIQRVDLGIYAIAGRCILDKKHCAELPDSLANGSLNNLVPRGKGWMFVSSWALPLSTHTHTAGEKAHHVVWAYVVPAQDNSDELTSFEAGKLKTLVLEGINGWSPSLKNVVQDSELSTINCIPLRSMPVLEDWASSNVTVLGDAIHNMTPMAGVGANTALRDAALLAEMLTEAANGKIPIVDAIGSYESRMRVYANEAVGSSKRNAVSASSGRGLQRWMFRTLLKAAQASPFVMRGTFGRAVVVRQ